MGKNIQKVQDMLDGNFKHKTQVGYTPTDKQRKVGDKWTDSDGVEWEQKEGYRSKIFVLPNVGMFSKQCKTCKKNCSIEKRHKHTWIRYNRCYHCQMNFEIDLQTSRIGNSSNKWVFWVRLQQLNNMETIEKEMIQWLEENEKYKNLEDKPFDESVANALANHNVDSTIKINKRMVQ